MFRNGPEVDGGGTAYLGPTTIIEMTIPMSQSSSDATLDDSWVLAGPISHIVNYWSWICCSNSLCLSSYLAKEDTWRIAVQRRWAYSYYDNSSAIKLSKNPVLHGRSKHIDVLEGSHEYGVINLVYCKSEDQVADIQTMPLKLATFVKLRGLLGVSSHATAKEDFVEGWFFPFKLISVDFSLREDVKI